MFCPECRSEYRPGFTRCAPCDVDLVDDLFGATATGERPGTSPPPESAGAPGPFVDYCGFLDLDEARRARDRLREASILARIAIRESPPGQLEGPVVEEFWLRVSQRSFAKAATVLGYDPADAPDAPDDDTFRCGACGEDVPADADVCPGCGARFEDGP